MASRAEARVYIVGDSKGFHVAMRRATWDAMTFQAKLRTIGGQLQTIGRRMSQTITLPIVGGLVLATKAAIAENQQMAVMADIVRKNTGATNEQITALETWIAKMQKQSTFSDGELRPSMQALVAVTKDVGEAQKLTTLAMDLAVAKGKPVETMAEALAKAYNGNVGILSRYGIATRDATGKSLDFAEVVKNAEATFGGTYATALDTSAGKLTNLKNRFGDIVEDIGRAVIPMLEKLVGYVERVATWFEGLDAGQRKLIVTLGLVAAAVGPVLHVFGSLMKVFSAGPWGVVITAVAAVVTAFITLYARSERFREAVQKVGGVARQVFEQYIFPAVQTVWSALVRLYRALEPTFPALRKIARLQWTVLITAVRTTWTVLKAVWSIAKPVLTALLKIGKVTLGGVITAIEKVVGALQWIIDKAQSAYEWLQRVFSARGPENARGSGGGRPYAGGGFNRPPGRKYGGTITGPRSGYPVIMHGAETVVSHEYPERGLSDLAKRGLLGVGGGGGLSVTFANCTFGYDPEEVGDAIESAAARSGLAMARG